jgi:hypothetical protein
MIEWFVFLGHIRNISVSILGSEIGYTGWGIMDFFNSIRKVLKSSTRHLTEVTQENCDESQSE